MEVRVLVALEDEYRAYREVLAAGFEAMRPGARVATTVPCGVQAKKARFDPHVIICSEPGPADAGGTTAWIELSTDPARPTMVRLGGRRFESSTPTFDALLEIVDEVGCRADAKERARPNESAMDGAAPTGG